ncbi:MAG: M1 family peptidase, partial [Flavobacteriales bacterium]
PMSSYLVAFAIGAYEKQSLVSASGVPIENYYYPEDRLLVEPTYRYTQRIFEFLETEIGVPYPWQNYKQVPVRDFLYAGMENTGTTLFSDAYVIDSIAFVDKNYVNVNAHELAHQWFGNLVTEEDGNHHWLHEGFATYYAYLTEKDLFGEDYFYWKLYDSFIALQKMVEGGKGQSLLDPKASSLVFYEKGAWALHMLREQIGEKAFKAGIRSFLEQYRFKNVTVSEFLSDMETASGVDLMGFKKEWLENEEMPTDAIRKNLMANSLSLASLFQLQESLKTAPAQNFDMEDLWEIEGSVNLKEYILTHYDSVLGPEIIKSAFESDEIPLRRALAIHGNAAKLPKPKFESLLNDNSYVTIENALFQLWAAYPELRAQYLDKTKSIVGLPNKNVRQLWLTLAVLTDGYDGPNTKNHFDELCRYTGPEYSFEVRQIAFQFLKEAFGFTDGTLLNLVGATGHYYWQFRDFARRLLDELLEDEVYKQRIVTLSNKLKPEEKRYLQTKINQP